MKERKLPLLLFLALLALTGQLLAAPLMACHQPGEMAHGEHEMDCCPGHDSGEALAASMDTQAMNGHEGQQDSGLAASGMVKGCDQHCFQCPALMPDEVVSAQAPPLEQIAALLSLIPLSRLDAHFRPPVSA